MDYTKIKESTMSAIQRYVEHHIPTGDFLYAVLTNNLFEAVGRADAENIQTIPEICCYIYNEIPSIAWGSAEKVKIWLKGKSNETPSQD
jgi:hypothetical protein